MLFSQPRSISLIFISAIVFSCVASIAHAGTATSISGLYATGANTYTVQVPGRDPTFDSNWNITTGDAYVVTNTVSGWMANPNGSKWISYSSDGFPAAPTAPATTYAYTLTFTIAGTGNAGDAVSNVSITLRLAVDDTATISVNGISTGQTGAGWTTANLKTVVLNSSNSNFKQGSNTLTIYVANSGGGATGLLVSSIGGVVPEVGTWIPVLGGLLAFVCIRFRPKKSALPAAV